MNRAGAGRPPGGGVTGRTGRRRPRRGGRRRRRRPGRPGRRRRPPRARTSRLVTPSRPTSSPWAKPLAVATPTRRPVKSPGPTSTATASTSPRATPAWSRTWAMAGATDSACRRRPVAQTTARGPALVGHGHPDQLGRRLDTEQDHRRPSRRSSPGATASASRGPPVGPGVAALDRHRPGRRRRPAEGRAPPSGRRDRRPGRPRRPIRRGPRAVRPLHRASLDELGQAEVGHLGQPVEPVDVGVEELAERARVLADERERRARHRPFDAEPPGEPLGERRLAGAEAADEQQDVAGPDLAGAARRRALGCRSARTGVVASRAQLTGRLRRGGAWPGRSRLASRPGRYRRTAAPPRGGTSGRGARRRTGTPGPAARRMPSDVSRRSLVAKLPSVTTTRGAISSSWRSR